LGASFLLLAGWVVSTSLVAEAASGQWWVRVLVVESSPVVNLGSPAGVYAWELAARGYVASPGPGKALNLRGCCQGQILLADGRAAGPLGARSADGSPVSVNGQRYRGHVEVHAAGNRLLVVNVVELEEYLRGVIRGEVPPDWPLEALKAQAIVARSYAVYQVRHNAGSLWHLKATVESQVYRGVQAEDPRTSSAVEQTGGLVLARWGQPIPAFYHADSGGHTEDAAAVFPKTWSPVPLVGVEDPHSLGSPYFVWQQVLPLDGVRRALAAGGYDGGPVVGLEPAEFSRTGRIQTLRVHTADGAYLLEGKRFRELMGWEVVRSTRFTASVDGRVARLIGRGWGHGVGMPQWGAKGMAELAYRAPEILRFYFPSAEIQPLEILSCCLTPASQVR
jgi:stage II sporulation protein D